MRNQVEQIGQKTGKRASLPSHLDQKWKGRFSDFTIGAILPLAIILVWELFSYLGLISTFFLPSPSMIAEAFWELTNTGQISQHLGVSLGRAVLGFLLGGTLGLLSGIWVGFSRHAEDLLDPSMQMFRMIPHLAIAPLIILWFGFGEVSKILIIAKGAFFPLYIQTYLGIRGVDNKLFEVANILNFNRYAQIVKLIVPAALPNILLGLRLSLAIAWLGLVAAELIGSESGVGFLINLARQHSNTEIIFVGVIIFAVVGKLIDSFVRILERRLLKWRDSYQG
ncbi:ABC transporter permease [Halalkalibacter kiskunsagensis]|uniref:ABC transporter permease n=1 Tax=Halalkalibacter kiskunsagensis TaxID=1548599 RepID=A0ABV6KLD3_9BACI